MSNFDRVLQLIFKDSDNDKKLMIIFNIRYIYKIFRLLLMAVAITYFIAGFWFLVCMELIRPHNPIDNFIDFYDLSYDESPKTSFEK